MAEEYSDDNRFPQGKATRYNFHDDITAFSKGEESREACTVQEIGEAVRELCSSAGLQHRGLGNMKCNGYTEATREPSAAGDMLDTVVTVIFQNRLLRTRLRVL